MTDRVYNFSSGPAVLPLPVLEQAQRELLNLRGAGASILEISHRSSSFGEILESAQRRLSELFSLPDNYEVVFLQGGARLQFSMIPMNLLRGTRKAADFIITGSWGNMAIEEAQREGQVGRAWDGKPTSYDRVPQQHELHLNASAAYAYFTSNETIEGVQFAIEPEVGDVPLVCDASSDFLSRPLQLDRYGVVFACAQKNAGPAGVTIVIIRQDLLERSSADLPGYLNYRSHVMNKSLFNTPPTFAIYLVDLVSRWLQEEVGGLATMHEHNRRKAQLLYEVLDASRGFYSGHAHPSSRSLMNVTFRLASDELETKFVQQAVQRRLCNLRGHRSVGGIRASIYNAMPLEGVAALRDFMQEFMHQHQR
jgi:phosphoserine aminotransferase